MSREMPLEIIHTYDARYVLTRPLEWRVGHASGPIYTVPAGFGFNIPPFISGLLTDDSLRAIAINRHMVAAGWNRISVVGEFNEALKKGGVPILVRLPIMLATALWH